MQVRCEHCRCDLKIEESVLPAGGARVRCPRCEQSFFVTPTGASDQDAAHALAREALAHAEEDEPQFGGPLGENGEFSLDDSPARPQVAPTTLAAPGPSESFEEESDWQFNDGTPASRPTSVEPEVRAAPRKSFGDFLDPGADAAQASLEVLGSPESWDFRVGRERIPRGTARSASPSTASAAQSGGVAAPGPAQVSEGAARVRLELPRGRESTPRAAVSQPPRGRLSQIAGWAICSLLLLATLHGSLTPSSAAPQRSASAVVVSGLEVTDVRSRRVENAFGDVLFVVSGSLRNPGAAPLVPAATLDVVLLGESGEPLDGQRAPAGAALDENALREVLPEALLESARRSSRELASLPLRPGESVSFDAIFERLPGEAAGVGFDSSPLPPQSPVAGAPEAPSPDAPETSAEPGAARTEASPPSPLPSSG